MTAIPMRTGSAPATSAMASTVPHMGGTLPRPRWPAFVLADDCESHACYAEVSTTRSRAENGQSPRLISFDLLPLGTVDHCAGCGPTGNPGWLRGATVARALRRKLCTATGSE